MIDINIHFSVRVQSKNLALTVKKARFMKRTLVLSATVATLIAATAWGIFLMPSLEEEVRAADPRNLPPLVRLATVQPADALERSFTGTVAAKVQSDLGFRIAGKIVQRLVEVGDKVQEGQPLLRIDETDYRLSLAAKRNAVIAARAAFVQAQAEEKRSAALVKSNAASAQQYDRSKALLDTASAQLAAAEADAEVAENEVGYSILLADADGTIIATLAEPGQVVQAGQPVIRLAKAGPREAMISLPENMRPAPGAMARAAVYGRGGEEAAVLRQISDAADQQTRTYETRWVLQGAAASAPLGATVTVTLQDSAISRLAEVPLGAIVDDGARTGVWVFSSASSKVNFRDVEVRSLGQETAIVSNLKPGETIVALGAHLLQDGVTVRTDVEMAEAAN